jgi:neurofibromin 1
MGEAKTSRQSSTRVRNSGQTPNKELPSNEPIAASTTVIKDRRERASVSSENNVLLDPDVITDFTIQALTLTVLATLVKNSSDEGELRVLYEYLAEASVVFPRVFPIV